MESVARGGTNSNDLALARVKHIAKHVQRPLKVASVSGSSKEQLQRHFWRGLLAHLLLVPPWVVPPGALLATLIGTGVPFGLPGVSAAIAIGGALISGPALAVRGVLVSMLGAMAYKSRKISSLISAVVAALLCWVASTSASPGPCPRLIDFIMQWASHYYRRCEVRGALEDIKPEKSFIGWHPHGCLCAGFTISGTFNPKFLEAAGKINFLCDPALRHRNPGFRLLCEAYKTPRRAIEGCDSATFKKFMSQGENIVFIPGGFLDACAFSYGKDRIVLKDKTIFVKYCLQYGYRAHPVYTFGESKTFYTFTGLESFRMRVARKNIPMIAFFGLPLIPFLPFPQAELISYVGAGIDFPRIPEPTTYDIAHWHAIYVAALRRLFEDKKVEAGYPDAQLEIL